MICSRWWWSIYHIPCYDFLLSIYILRALKKGVHVIRVYYFFLLYFLEKVVYIYLSIVCFIERGPHPQSAQPPNKQEKKKLKALKVKTKYRRTQSQKAQTNHQSGRVNPKPVSSS